MSTTDTTALLLRQPNVAQRMQADKLAAELWCLQNGYPIRESTVSGGVSEIQKPFRDDYYEYDATDNLISAQTIGTDRVRFGGGLGLDLTGAGFNVWIWDGGTVTPHVEFVGRFSAGGKGDFLLANRHATHVSGTLISSGNANPLSQGMATQAELKYETFNFDVSEMMLAAAEGALLSNHSYGRRCGWWASAANWYWYGDISVSLQEDYRFGFYSLEAKEFDQVAYAAPYYTIVKSAGNDRDDTGPPVGASHFVQSGGGWVLATTPRNPDGAYDCLPPRGTAKNILTVGAVDDIPGGYVQPSDVVIAGFSSWGPTDDGRIKPDLVANGIGVFSTIDTFGFASYSGTSMSAPAVTGSIVLLQEHYSRTHNFDLMRSATVRALVIHTADEAGIFPGPDYAHGWGLMNTATAALHIGEDAGTPDLIRELTLAPGDTFRYDFIYSGQFDPYLKATIAWTDPSGTPVTPQVDPAALMLVNDLDLRIQMLGPSVVTYSPWILDPFNPGNPATTGDNFRDNVEVVHLPNPVVGASYRVVVTHKGSGLSNNLPQHFSLILSGIDLPATAATPENAQNWTITAFPLPAQEVLHLEVDAPQAGRPVGVEFYSVNGEKVWSQSLVENSRIHSINVAEWESGIYLYRLWDAKGRMASGKVLIH
ncbi:MAG: S8 family serine peptidase [Bacteroidota bacterium]